MAERRMFSKLIIDSDAFLDMPLSAQALYFHLSMRADDDGFLNNPSRIMRVIGSNKNDIDLLLFKNFIIAFETGIIVIKHWRMNNYIQKDRYKPTVYNEEKDRLEIKSNGAYTLIEEDLKTLQDGTEIQITKSKNCIQPVYKMDSQVRLGKDRLDKTNKERTGHFVVPTLSEINEYCKTISSPVDPESFYDYYTSNGWMVGKSKMKDWKATVRRWGKNEISKKPSKPNQNFKQDTISSLSEHELNTIIARKRQAKNDLPV